MIRILATAALLAGAFIGVSSAAPPSTATVLERGQAFARALPTDTVEYEVRDATSRNRRLAVTLTASRAFAGAVPELVDSAACRLYGALLRGEGAEALRAAGVALTRSRLFHLHRRVVVVIGGRPLEPGVPEVWLDRDTGAPVRIRLEAEQLTLFAHDWPGTGGAFPGRFELERGTARLIATFRRRVPAR